VFCCRLLQHFNGCFGPKSCHSAAGGNDNNGSICPVRFVAVGWKAGVAKLIAEWRVSSRIPNRQVLAW
jgi:hypothetical protein